MQLTLRQRASWLAHLTKATTQQHHGELSAVFRPYIPQNAVVLDVGAHAGQFSKLFAKLAPLGTVYAFEPSCYARSILHRVVKWRNLANVEVVPTGLSDAAADVILRTPLTRSGSLGFGRSHVGRDVQSGFFFHQKAELGTIDDFVAQRQIGKLDFVKIDVEGWELHVLRGGYKTLRRFHPVLYLEVSDTWLEAAGETPDSLWRLLNGLGYSAYTTPDLTLSPDYTGPGDYLFAVESRAPIVA